MIFKTFTCPYAKTHSLFLQRRLTRNGQCSENTVKVLRCQTFSPSSKLLDFYSNIKGISENVKHCMFPSIVKNPENPPQPSAGNLLWILSVTETETISIQCFFITKSRMKLRNIEEDIEAFQANHLLCENANSGQITFGFGWMLINFDNELLAMLSSSI